MGSSAMQSAFPGHLTPSEAARSLGLRTQTLTMWRSEERGPPWSKRGLREIVYPREEFVAWCQENNVAILLPLPADAASGLQ